jgi:hypothetical protein
VCYISSFFCQRVSCPEPVNEFPFDFEILRHKSWENLISMNMSAVAVQSVCYMDLKRTFYEHF